MAITDKNTIYSWFQTDDFPTEAQFRATWDSFWHKSESIPVSQITGLNELFIQMLSYGINICISKHKLPLDFLLKSLEELRRNGYENKWTWGRKRIKGTALTCEIICEVTMDKFYAEFIVSDKTTIIYRRDILTDKPSWISNSYFLKNKFLIRDDKILLADNLGKITFEEKISKLKFGHCER